jgi:GNAT superfamily N-acetyltransferase
MYRRVFGNTEAEADRLRWDWQYRRNPNCAPEGPQIWVAREGTTVIGHYATMPVRLLVNGQDIAASWGMDMMVVPERQRQGLGEVLFRTWDRHVGASLGLGQSESSFRLFQKLRWPNLGPVPCLVKPLTRRALRRPNWPMPVNRFVSAVTLPFVRIVGRVRPMPAELPSGSSTTNSPRSGTGLPKFAFIVRRDRRTELEVHRAPHVRCSVAALRGGELQGYAVYRHVWEPRGRVTLLVDFLVDPDDESGMLTLLRWVDREARRRTRIRFVCSAC